MIDKMIAKTQELTTYALMTCALILAGCAKQQQYEAINVEPQVIYLENIEKITAMKIAEDVLGRMHFAIEKADPNIGLIRTRPLPAAQFFEFWRKDNVGRLNSAEANLHSIQRIVQLNIAQENNNVRIVCSAQVYRLSLPRRQSTSTAQAYRMFSESSPDMQRLKLRPEQEKGMAWINLGHDQQLATKILNRIKARMIDNRSSNVSNTSDEI